MIESTDNGKSVSYQEVNGVVRSHFAAINEALSECGHHVLHQVVTQGNGLSLQ